MAQNRGSCTRDRGAGDGEMDKSRKVALITGITGQEPCALEFLVGGGENRWLSVHGYGWSSRIQNP
uniref:Uncharacterized protein n=1 Tax=Vombatus ursinus TaxID=29139 RepID=A0A4X2KAV3_VOMUR